MPPKKTTTSSTKKPAAKAGAKPAAKASKTTKKSDGAASTSSKTEEVTEQVAEMKMIDGIEIGLKEIAVVANNKNPKILASGRYPLIIDKNGNVSTFLRHRDCNYINVMDKSQLEEDRIRLALLGGIRFGKPMIIDLMGLDTIWETIEEKFESIQKGLLTSIYDKSITKEEKFSTLIDLDKDEKEYTELYQYTENVIENFIFIVLTTEDNVPDRLKCSTMTVTVT